VKEAAVSRQVVVCCDGTWNEPDELRAGVAAPTNVAKLALCVVADAQQLLFYEPGVGTARDERIVGGGFGYGLSQNIRSCYAFLAQQYEPGDDLFLFGFSRGAYTARSLAGLIHNCGLLRPDHADRVDEAFAFYRDRTSQTHPSTLASQLFREMYSHPSDEIHFIGVWDTVGALGIPTGLPGVEELDRHQTPFEHLWGFHDTQLGAHVRNARHALAIDEQREPFAPTLWTQEDAAEQTLAQVWFSGVHSEVGGGSRDASLSDVALLWMADQARACGLRITPGRLQVGADDGAGGAIAPNYAGPIVDSRKGMYDAMRPFHRLEKLPVGGAPGQSLASSAVRRADERVAGYAPPGLPGYRAALAVTDVTG
jgi:uncharacterized protein (DUF2235 family)